MAWATIEDVKAVTDRDVTDATRNLAALSIELHTGLIEDVPRADMSDRDLYWLRQATCFQAAWLLSQPDYLERLAVTSASQDGQSANAGNADWLTLAPLTRKALRRLTWRSGMRSIAQPVTPRVRNINSDEYEETLNWKPVV